MKKLFIGLLALSTYMAYAADSEKVCGKVSQLTIQSEDLFGQKDVIEVVLVGENGDRIITKPLFGAAIASVLTAAKINSRTVCTTQFGNSIELK